MIEPCFLCFRPGGGGGRAVGQGDVRWVSGIPVPPTHSQMAGKGNRMRTGKASAFASRLTALENAAQPPQYLMPPA